MSQQEPSQELLNPPTGSSSTSSRFILPPPPSDLMARLQAFLPQIKQANEMLTENMQTDASEGATGRKEEEEVVVLEEFSSDEDDESDDSDSSSEASTDDDEGHHEENTSRAGVANRGLIKETELEEEGEEEEEAPDGSAPLARLLDITARPKKVLHTSRGATSARSNGIVEMSG